MSCDNTGPSVGSKLFYRVRGCVTSESRGRHGTVKETTERSSEEAELRHYDQVEERYRVPRKDDRLRQSHERNPGRSHRIQKQLSHGKLREPHSAWKQHTLRLCGPSTTVERPKVSFLAGASFVTSNSFAIESRSVPMSLEVAIGPYLDLLVPMLGY